MVCAWRPWLVLGVAFICIKRMSPGSYRLHVLKFFPAVTSCTACRENHKVLSNGCRRYQWFLVDRSDALHLAVEGLEEFPRDGHYSYIPQEPFASRNPIGSCKTRTQVLDWLQYFVKSSSDGPSFVRYEYAALSTQTWQDL